LVFVGKSNRDTDEMQEEHATVLRLLFLMRRHSVFPRSLYIIHPISEKNFSSFLCRQEEEKQGEL